MSKFRDWWVAKNNPEARAAQIDLMIKEIDAEFATKVDPTRWNKLLDQKEVLEQEREGLSLAPLRME
jgi:hypothetical protein